MCIRDSSLTVRSPLRADHAGRHGLRTLPAQMQGLLMRFSLRVGGLGPELPRLGRPPRRRDRV
eukprot:15472870-Alexandrium_andersonii.AAC.1